MSVSDLANTDVRRVVGIGTTQVLFSPNQRPQLEADLMLMKEYLQMCFRKEDWHGVMDASADIREIVAKLSVLTD